MKKVLIPILIFFAASWIAVGGAGQEKGGGRKEKAEQKTVQTQKQSTAETEKAATKAAEKAETKDTDKTFGRESRKAEEVRKDQEDKKVQEAKNEKSKEAKEAEEQAAKGKGKSEEMKGKGKDQAQQGVALEKQLAHEEQKHLTRQARLEKMLEVAKEKGDDKAAARIQSLMDKEKTRFGKKHTKMTGRAGETQQEAAEAGKKSAPKKEKNKD